MAFTLPHNLIASGSVKAEELQENYDEARKAFSRLAVGDFNTTSFTRTRINGPDQIGPSRAKSIKWNAVSGVFYGTRSDTDIRTRSYVSSHVKQANFTSKATYVDVPRMGHQLTLQRAACCQVFVWASVEGYINDVLTDSGNSNRFFLYVDDVQQAETLCYVCDLDGAKAFGSPARAGEDTPRWSPFCFTWAGTLTAGTHTFTVKADPWLERCYVTNVKFLVDVYYYA